MMSIDCRRAIQCRRLGSHTYSFINANKTHWVKFHFKTMQGIKNGPMRSPERSRRTARPTSATCSNP